MKLEITLPEWTRERHIAVMAGMELVAYRPYGKNYWLVKTERCNFCGWCCATISEGFPKDGDGACIYLGPQIGQHRQCTLGFSKPWRCSWSDPILTNAPGAEEHCAIRYEKVID